MCWKSQRERVQSAALRFPVRSETALKKFTRVADKGGVYLMFPNALFSAPSASDLSQGEQP